ncbi:hypothetical protein LTR70_009380 [Exophiala xenobiotica]|uniref:Uncharacterized protein n=1 Tax=Lithohypha guttulata TaxID=1690604 RepID=A0ABR0JYB9_9EURO|nr:hypothetical protein LTR24_009239 [Lithohypha guttulata]KAK5310563.1 hypothetical protein LTR70_009380 [Exophiala xenobiotica]
MKSYILATLAITPLFLTGSVAAEDPPERPNPFGDPWRVQMTRVVTPTNTVTASKREADPNFQLHDKSNRWWQKSSKVPPHENMSKRGEWEDVYNYAVTWAGTETAGQYEATHTGEPSVDFYGMPISKRAEASGGAGGSGQAPGKGDGQAQGAGQSQDKSQQGEKGEGGEGQHSYKGQGRWKGGPGAPAATLDDGPAMGSGMPPKQGEGH